MVEMTEERIEQLKRKVRQADATLCDECAWADRYADDVHELLTQISEYQTFKKSVREIAESMVAERREAASMKDKLLTTIVRAAVPLEAIHASVEWELCDEIKQEVADAVADIRAVIRETK